jgi:hypothetical protein
MFFTALVVGISSMFSLQIPLLRRLAISYLVLTGLAYFLAGLLGLIPSWGLIETQMWYTYLVSPYPALSLLVNGIPDSQHDIRWAYIGVTPDGDSHTLFSAGILGLGLVAFMSAIGMGWKKRIAYRIWLALAVFFTLCTVGYAVASILRWGMKEVILPLSLTASYMAAFLIARMHVNLGDGILRQDSRPMEQSP